MDSEKVINMIPKTRKPNKGIISFLIIAVVVIVVALNSFVVVPAGHRGVVLQLGAVKDVVLSEGLHFKIPFIQQVMPVEVRVQKSQSEHTASSKDLQTVSTTVAVNYHLDPNTVNKLYQQVGLSYEDRIVAPAVGESVKAITAKYTAEELISKRPEVSAQIKETLANKLGTYYMVLDEINITEFRFSDEFNAAIEQKQIAEQQALKARLDLQRVQIEAQQKLEQAKAEAESLRLQKQEVTPELIQLRQIEAQMKAIEKWDGKLPAVTGGAAPFIDINALTKN